MRSGLAALALFLAGPGAAGAGSLAVEESFVTGWNLVGNSGDTPLEVTAVTTGAAVGKVTSVWVWNAAQGRWSFYAPSLAASGGLAAYVVQKGYDTLQDIPPGTGYWVNANSPFVQTRSVNPVAGNLLVAGWNLGALGEARLPDAFAVAMKSAIGADPVSLWAWDSAAGKWYFHAPTLVAAGTLSGYVQQKGYLDFAARALAPGTGFWVNAPAGGFVAGLGSTAASEVLVGTVYPAVSGLRYRTASQSGHVDSAGRYHFRRGEQVEFSIGAVAVTSLPAQSEIVFLPTDDPLVSTNILRVVKALDTSGDLADGIAIPPMPGANPQGVRLDDEAAVAAVLSQLKPGATLPPASDPQVAAALASARQKAGRSNGSYGARYESFQVDAMNASYCPGARKVTAATVRLVSQPDWAAGLLAGEVTLTLNDGASLVFAASTVSGQATVGGTPVAYTFRRGPVAGRPRVLLLEAYVGGDSLCQLSQLALRDGAQANRPPIIRADLIWEVTPDTLGVGWTLWRTEGEIRRYQSLGFLPQRLAAWDPDGHVVKLDWSASNGTTGSVTASTTNAELYGLMMVQLQINKGQKLDLKLVATDDQGATSEKVITLGSGGTIDDRLRELDGKLFVRRVVSTDSSGELYADSQYYLYDSASGRVYQIMCIDRLRTESTIFPSWATLAGLTGAKQCWESSLPAADPEVRAALDSITPLGTGRMLWRDPENPALTMQFVQTDAIPAGYTVYDDSHNTLRTTDGKGAGMVKPTPALGSDTGSWSGSGGGDQSAIGQACLAAYAGPKDDPQFDTSCRMAQWDGCVDKATGTTTYKREAESVCRSLNALIEASSGGSYNCPYCPYPGP